MKMKQSYNLYILHPIHHRTRMYLAKWAHETGSHGLFQSKILRCHMYMLDFVCYQANHTECKTFACLDLTQNSPANDLCWTFLILKKPTYFKVSSWYQSLTLTYSKEEINWIKSCSSIIALIQQWLVTMVTFPHHCNILKMQKPYLIILSSSIFHTCVKVADNMYS